MGFEDVPTDFDEYKNRLQNKNACGCYVAAVIFCLGLLVVGAGGAEIIHGYGEIGAPEIACGVTAAALGLGLFYLKVWSKRNPEA